MKVDESEKKTLKPRMAILTGDATAPADLSGWSLHEFRYLNSTQCQIRLSTGAPETQALAFHRLLTGEGAAEIYHKGKLRHELVGRSQPGNGGGMIRLCHGEPMVNPNIPDRQTTRVVEGVDDLEETAVMAGRTRNRVTARRAGIEPRTYYLAGPSA